MALRSVCPKCSHSLRPWEGDQLHCDNCNLLWKWDAATMSLTCLGYPPPPRRDRPQQAPPKQSRSEER